MPIPIDDLTPGMWVTVTRSKAIENQRQNVEHVTGQQIHADYTGAPVQIVALSLPFSVARDVLDRHWSFDLRAVELTKSNEKYAEAFAQAAAPAPADAKSIVPLAESDPQNQLTGPCPMCGQ